MNQDKNGDNCDVLLVQPRSAHNMDARFLPFGLLFLVGSLQHHGFTARILDLNIEPPDKLDELLQNPGLLFVGFSVITGPMILDVLSASVHIRELRPKLPIVWRGPHPTIDPELTAAHPLVDVVVRGEGDRTAVRLAKAFREKKDLADIPGLTFERDGKLVSTGPVQPLLKEEKQLSLKLDNIDFKPYLFSSKGKKCCFILTSRGCPYRCGFCWNVMFHDRKYLGWEIDSVWNVLQPLFNAGVQRFLILDSFVGSVGRVTSLANMFKSEGVQWAIEDGCRVDVHCDKSLFEVLEDSGCSHICFGAESGSQRILDHIHKDIKVEDLINSASARRETQIGGRYQWMVGIPGETKSDTLQTLDVIEQINRINPRSGHSVELFSPYPGSELFDEACAAGWQPPQSLKEWGQYRWEGEYPHHQGKTWFFKSVRYSQMFYRFRKMSDYSTYATQARGLFQLASYAFYPFAAIRSRTRFFDIPIEYQLAELTRRKLENWTDSRRRSQ
jgi:radical SAM superfamily enzyme YgiQ (UPF0313 family)